MLHTFDSISPYFPFALPPAGMSSIFTLTTLSASRWLLVTRAGRFPLSKRGVTAAALAAVWAAAAAVAVPPLAGWSYYAPESSGLR